jgi:hypothetical protein
MGGLCGHDTCPEGWASSGTYDHDGLAVMHFHREDAEGDGDCAGGLAVPDQVEQVLGDDARHVAGLNRLDLDLRLVAFEVELTLDEDVAAETCEGDFAEGFGGAIGAKEDLQVLDGHILTFEVILSEVGGLLFGQAEGDGLAGIDAGEHVVPVRLQGRVGRGRRRDAAVDAGLGRAGEHKKAGECSRGDGHEEDAGKGKDDESD